MAAHEISIAEAKKDKLFYVVVCGVVYRRSDGRCLILKRDLREKVHPGKYGVVGGKLEWADLDLSKPSKMNGEAADFDNALDDLLRREAREEAGVEIGRELMFLKSLAIVRPDGIPVAMLEFAVEYVSGDVVPEPGAFTDFAWVNAEEVKNYDCIEGIMDEVARTVEAFKRLG